ncbi:MAG: hypothetical protein AMXMBFR53_25880 [Gemmatimonadota bacterium]
MFYDRRGVPVPEAPPRVEVGERAEAASGSTEPGSTVSGHDRAERDPVDALVRANLRRGVDPSWDTASCRWRRADETPLDVLERAEEAA